MPTLTFDGIGAYYFQSYSTDGGDYDFGTQPVTLSVTLSDDHLAVINGGAIETLAGSISDITATYPNFGSIVLSFDDFSYEFTDDGYWPTRTQWSVERIYHPGGVTDTLVLDWREDTEFSIDSDDYTFWFPLAGPDIALLTYGEIFGDPPLLDSEAVEDGPLADAEGFSFFTAAEGGYPGPEVIPGVALTADPEGSYLNGGAGRDTLTGGDGDDLIPGRGGSDRLYGNGGNDALAGGDTIEGGDGDDTIGGGTGNDVIRGGLGNDLIGGGQGDDMIWAGVYNDLSSDTVSAGLGDDYVWAGEGDDLLSGSFGDDTIYAGDGNNIVGGGQGHDRIEGSGGNDQFFAGSGADTLHGLSGDDLLFGGDGSDRLAGGFGADTLRGGRGDDQLFGNWFGPGVGPADGEVDIFQFNANINNGSDTIGGFDAGLDIIEIRGLTSVAQIDVTSAAGSELTFGFGPSQIRMLGLTTEDFETLIFEFV
ncbi:calcium-binding protein [Aestuariicoccus sp. MJ-SS9]|uniref:calcium-binding protein n=1 Tax=Aestuariicoccus sp. MJ-SS9 TaxID=3079855 RepID=UPI00290DF279|nr:calcium-binding protein [Aestuariicoccus sp. MJ-SS9]MDU8912057.1 calcium-binding protein [Aestuariicoccus sp. MJ-SS9]